MMTAGSTSMPTDTKNMAPNKFFTGSTSFIILSASIVSARMLPITKAPKAELKPTFVDITAIRKHRPSDTMMSVSLFISRRVALRNSGTMNMPTTNHSMRKNTILTMLPSICPLSGLFPPAIAESSTIMTIASTSSRISTLITRPANVCCRSPRSSKAL